MEPNNNLGMKGEFTIELAVLMNIIFTYWWPHLKVACYDS